MNNIAIFGFGIVGKGVYDLLKEHEDKFRVVKVFDIPAKKDILGDLLETDMDKIMESEDIDTIVECLGGDTLPHEVITKALKHHKNVVSSNKETLSRHMKEYLDLANESGSILAYEASVGGGIPLIYPLSIQSRFDEIYEIQGILNATCNFILTKMSLDNMELEDAILLAQQNGFAERDPSADLMGLDMIRKGNVIAMTITNKELSNDEIPHFGIEHISKKILDFIKSKKRTLRFVVKIKLTGDNISLVVVPLAITNKNPLIHVKYENNGAIILDKHNGPLTFLGKGAGRYPTASAILQDLIRIHNHIAFPYPKLKCFSHINPDLSGNYYVFNKDEFVAELKNPSQDELLKYDFVCRVDE